MWFLFDFWFEIGLIEKEHRILVCAIIIFYVFVGDSNGEKNRLGSLWRRLSCTLPNMFETNMGVEDGK